MTAPPEVRERARKIVTGVLDGVERDIQYFTTTAKPHPVVDVRLVLAKPAAPSAETEK